MHYHIVIKLDKVTRWFKSKKYLLREYSVSVHCSSTHENYYSAWRYLTKQDKEYAQITKHPELATQTNLAQLQQGELEKLLPLLKKEMTSYQIALMMEVQVRSKDEKN